ncbi:MAG: hypothetical protein KIT84_34825 [Labilithrix sp.]|nr:hypothetical protein [Labilithrix sp.]MCW5816224.1 hypothetical protein [Labilithrix sp.]
MKSLLVPVLAFALYACGSDSGGTRGAVGLNADVDLPDRRSSVVVDGCVLDTWQRSTLATASAKRVLRGGDVILLCLVPREDGTVGPRDPSAKAALAGLVGDIKREGYRVHLGVSFTDESGQRYDGAQTRAWLAQPAWQRRFLETVVPAVEAADGVEIDLQKLPDDARADVTSLVRGLAGRIRPQKRLGVFIPPSVTTPSDLPGGEAFNRVELAPHVDRMRVMTLDYSESQAGPTIDPGWAVDAVRLAQSATPNVDVSFPLYGIDFGPRGVRGVSYNEAIAAAAIGGQPIYRGPTQAAYVSWTSFGGESHMTWFDDADSTAVALGGWAPPVLGENVGVLFYSLGAEDPKLWDSLARRLP